MGNQQAADSPSSDCDQHGVMQPLSLDPRNLLSRAIFGSPEATLKTLPEEKPPDSEQQPYASDLFPSDISALISNIKLGIPLKVLPEERVISLRIGAHRDSLLHVASEHGNIAVVKQLVKEYKCSPLIYNNNECTSIYSAAKGGNLPVLKYLIGICKENASASNEGGGNERESREEAVEGKMKNEEMIIVPYDPAVQAASKDFPDNHDDSESTAEATSGSCYSIDKCGNSLLHVSSMYGHLKIAVYLCSDTETGITMMAPNIDGQNPLHLAAKHGRFEVVEYLTTLQNCTPSARENEGRTALHLAIDGGHLKIVQFLVDGSFCNPADTVGRKGSYVTKTSTVHIAAQRGHLEILKYLVDIAGCNLYERDGCDNLPIHLAVIHGHLNIVEHLISEKWHNPFCRGEEDKTVVHMASQYGHLDILKFFVERVKLMPYHQDIADFLSADKNKYLIHFETFLKTLLPNYQRKRRNTTLLQNDVKRLYGCDMKNSLIKSIKSGDFKLQNAIGFIDSAVNHYRAIQSKIYKFCRDVNGRSPLHYACMEGHVHIAKFLIEVCNMNHLCTDDIDDTPLHYAAKRGHVNVVKYLIEERHSTILCRNKFSIAPLHYAVREGKLGVVQYILTKTECDSMLKGPRDGTVLHCASFYGHLEVVKYLCDVQGVDPSCVDVEQCTPLHVAAAMGHLHVVKFFIEKSSPSQNKYIKNKSTPVHLSACHGHLDVMEYLVTSTGFDYLCKGNKGWTLAHYATMKGHLHILKHLFQESRKIFNIRDDLQCTPLHVAAQYGQLKVLKYLAEDMKCNVLCLDEKNNTPLHLAAKAAKSQKECHLKVVKYLITKHRCDPLSKGSSRISPLHVACESSQHSIVECMLENIDAHNLSACLDEDNNTPLHTASLQGSLTIVKLLTENDQKQIVVRNQLFHTPLHAAAFKGHMKVVEYFIEERNCKSLLQDPAVSPTVLACTNGPLHLAKYLIDVMNKNQFHTEVSMRFIILSAVIGGQTDLIQYCSTCSYLGTPENSKHRAFHSFEVATDPCTVFFLADSEGQTIIGYRIHLPLHLACVMGQLHIAKYFIERFSVNHNQKNCDGVSPLHLAAYSGNLSLVKYLVEERNCSVQVADNDQRQPMHHAIMTNRLNVVKYFLTKEGCDIKTTIKYGFNSLHLACLHAKVEMVEYLIHDAILTSTDSMGRTPLHLAVLTNNMDVVKYFVERLAYDPIASISNEHFSPFQFASLCGKLQIVRYFIHERKCDPMLKNSSGKSLIHLASYSGHVKVVQYLVESCDVDINCQDENQHTSLHYSACEGHIEVVKYLVAKNCVVQMRGSKNNTALHLAAAKGRLAIVKFLLEEAKCDPMLEGDLKRTVFQFACGNGQFEIVMYLHEEIHLSLLHVDSQNLSLLHLSAMCGSLPITEYLIAKGCDAFQTDSNRNMPLHIAAMNGRFELVKYLLAHMKGYMFTGYAERTAFHYAALTGSLQIVKYIDQKYSVDLDCRDQYQSTPLHLASFKGKLEVVEYLIERGCDVSLQDYKLLIPFHYAVIEGHLKTVEYFISRNLCIASLKGSLQRTPVHIASLWGQLDIVKLLVEACKVNIHCRDQQRHTPLHLAAKSGHLDICKYLIEKGSDTSCANELDQTPFDLAANDGHIDVVKYLFEYCHCDVLRKDKDNTVALHFAAIGGRLNITKYLILTCKCDPKCRTSNGTIPLHFACRSGHLHVVKYYIDDLSINPLYPDDVGNTPLHLAAQNEQMDIIEYLVEKKNCSILTTNKHNLIPLQTAIMHMRWKAIKYFTHENLNEAKNFLPALIMAATIHDDLDLVERCFKLGPIDFSANVKRIITNITVTIKPQQSRFIDNASHVSTRSIHVGLPVHMASAHGRLSILKCLVKHGLDPDLLDNDHTPLHLAALYGQLHIVKYLVESHNCKVNRKNDFLYTPLHLAVVGKRLKVVKYLITEKGCNPMQKAEGEFTCLHFACNKGGIDMVKFLLEECKANPLCFSTDGDSPLHIAAFRGYLHIVKYLLENHFCEPGMKTKYGGLALHTASLGGNIEVVKYLIGHNDRLTTDDIGRSFVHYAAMQGQLKIIDYAIDYPKIQKFTEDKQGCTPLHYAARNGNLEAVKRLVRYQDDSRHADISGKLPLHQAAECGHVEIVKYFIEEKKCNPSLCSKQGITPLHYASLNGHQIVVEYLITKCVVDVNCRNKNMQTPLHFAACSGKLKIIQYICENKGNILMQDELSCLPIHLAAFKGHLTSVQFLIQEKNCDPNTVAMDRLTPLKFATVNGHLHVVRFLIDQCKVPIDSETGTSLLHVSSKLGHLDLVKYWITNQHSDPSSPETESDITPLHTASFFGHLHVVRYLVEECNVDIALEDDDGYMPLHLACISGHLDIIKYMLDRGNNNVIEVCGNLVFLAAKNGHLEIVKFLAEELVLSLDQMVGSKKPLDIAHEEGHTDIVRYLFTKGYQSDIVQSSMLARPPLKPNVSMFVIGNTEAGKTTLIKSLQSPSSHTLTNWVMGLFKSVDSNETPSETTGIVPTCLKTDQLRNITAYDFAGPMEYYAGHKAFLGGISSSIIVITIDISHSVEASVKAFLYWHMFIRSITNASSVVRVIVAASHSDKLRQKEVHPHIAGIQDYMKKKQSDSVMYVACIPLDCRDTASQGFSKLTDIVDSCYRMACLELDLDYDNGSVLNVFLKTKFSQTTVCPLSTIHDSLTKINAPDLVPLKTPEILLGACKTLQESGYIEIILLELPCMTEVFIIQETEQFLTKVNSRVKHTKFPNANGLGIVSYSMLEQFLKKEFNDSDIISQVVIQYMVTKQFCSKVIDPEIIRKVAEVITASDEDMYFFPHLVQLDQPDGIWRPNPEFSYTCGWTLKCTGYSSFFHPRYFQNLFLRMAVEFALTPSIQRRSSRLEPCTGFTLWKNGVRWLDSAGIEVVVMVSGDQNTVLTLLMRCHGGAQLQVVKLRSYLVKEVFLVKNKYSPRCKTKEYIIHPHCLNQCPPHMPVEIEMSKVLVAIVRKEPNLSLDAKQISDAPGYPFLSIRDLLCYEGYAELGPALLQNLLTDENRHEVIDHNILKKLAATMQGKCPYIEQVLGISADSSSQKEPVRISDVLRRWASESGGKYETLRDALDKYSLFAKRSSEV